MITSPSNYTAALARLYAGQGYLRKAAEIYRYLINLEPDHSELREALADMERRIAQSPSPTRKDIELLMREWIELVKQSKHRTRDGYEQRRKTDEEDGSR
jgi:hypothetical protein